MSRLTWLQTVSALLPEARLAAVLALKDPKDSEIFKFDLQAYSPLPELCGKPRVVKIVNIRRRVVWKTGPINQNASFAPLPELCIFIKRKTMKFVTADADF